VPLTCRLGTKGTHAGKQILHCTDGSTLHFRIGKELAANAEYVLWA
jgi:hypothetical protein